MAESLTTAQQRVLTAMKRLGPVAPADLARHLDLTGAAIRQHLASLEAIGLAESQSADDVDAEPRRGRPATRWGLTPIASAHFPDRHADLTLDLIRSVRESLGENALNKLIETRAERQRDAYRTAMPPTDAPLRDRVEALASLRTGEGYMAEVIEESPGVLRLIEHHCPICVAAESCQGLCRAELDVFRKSLGDDVSVERTQHVLSDGDRCVYQICRINDD